MITVENEITLAQLDGKEAPVGSPKLIVRSVWNRRALVELQFQGEGRTFAVEAAELMRAIKNSEGL